MILILYNLGLLVALLVGAPWWLWQMATTRKYREGLGERLGGVPKRLLKAKFSETVPDGNLDAEGGRRVITPSSTAAGRPVIWIHAVSVGEVLAVSRLVSELDAALPGHRVLISTTTRTGQALARDRFGEGRVFYCPLDLFWAVGAYLGALKPAMLVLAETEFWPNLLTGCFRRGIPVAVVNARISDRSWPRYWRLRTFWRPWLGQISLALAQTGTDAERLRALGCGAATVGGNLKFDVKATSEAEATRLLRELGGGLHWVVAGSTLEGEEALLLEAWPEMLAAEPNLAMVVAPRHPERFGTVAGLLERSGIKWRRRSELSPEAARIASGEIVLLETIGELASVYSLAAVAFVGGSLVAAGGHNPLEPAQFGVPVVMGAHFANFRAIVEDLEAHEAIAIAGEGELAVTVARLLRDSAMAQAMGERGRQVFAAQAGATARTVAALRAILDAQPAGQETK
jgi:3-deoxy-D-manno-octulosonic-acid transferase